MLNNIQHNHRTIRVSSSSSRAWLPCCRAFLRASSRKKSSLRSWPSWYERDSPQHMPLCFWFAHHHHYSQGRSEGELQALVLQSVLASSRGTLTASEFSRLVLPSLLPLITPEAPMPCTASSCPHPLGQWQELIAPPLSPI